MGAMSVTEYARHRGVTHPYICNLLRHGKIERIAEGEDAGKLDPVACDARLAALRDPAKDGVRVRNEINRTKRGQPASNADAGAGPSGAAGADSPRLDPHDPSFSELQRSRAKSEAERARLLELERMEREGKLVDIEAVRKEAFARARDARNAVLAMPARMAPRFVPFLGEGVAPIQVERLLQDIARELCAQIADGRVESPVEDASA